MPSAGAVLRDRGMQLTLDFESSAWKESYRSAVVAWFEHLPRGETFSGEALRVAAKDFGVTEPHAHQVWAAMAASVLKTWQLAGLAVTTGNIIRAFMPKTHAHGMKEYRKI